MADHEKAAPSPCKCRARRRDYPQGKQRKETGIAGKWADTARLARVLPAGQVAETPRHAGIRAKKKGPETIRALLIGGADATGIQPTLSTIEQSRAILRVVVDAMASAMNAGQSVQGGLSPCAAPIDR